eukprot:Gb_28254 [translate_table: standard]
MKKIKMTTPKVLQRLWSYFIFLCSKRARLTGQSPDGRERALLDYVRQNAEKSNPESVLNAIDNYTKHTWLMNIGHEKGSILDAAAQKNDPRVALELGTYCGYSAIRLASKMTKPESKLISLEMNPHNRGIARAIIEHAGLSSKIDVVEGTLGDVVEELGEFLDEMGAPFFDFIFFDHFKQYYLPDFMLLKDRGMLGKGTCIVANSIGFPGAQDFLNYLRSHCEELETEEHTFKVEYMNCWPHTVSTVSTYKAELPLFLRT